MSDEILFSWEENAEEWVKIIDSEGITSRKVTNRAIVETVLAYQPKSVFDMGCGEGWLTRELNSKGIKTIGVDGTKALIEQAKLKSHDEFYRISYQEIIENKSINSAKCEATLFNFSLYQKDELKPLFITIQNSLKAPSLIFIQTLHPFNLLKDDFQYKSQWIGDAWKGLKGNFTHSHRWYYRTLEGWINLFKSAGLELLKVKEPIFPEINRPASIIFILKGNNS